MSFYDVSFMVSGRLVQEWPSFCRCDEPDGITHERPGCLDSYPNLIPGLTETDLDLPRACRSFALDLHSLNLSGACPTLWVEEEGSGGERLVFKLGTPNCGVSRLILAGRKEGSTAQRPVLNCLAQKGCPVGHLVFLGSLHYSKEEAENLAEQFKTFQVPLSSLAFVSTPLHIDPLVDILRSASKISDLLIHSPKNLSGKNFDKVVRALRENAHLQRLSLTSCGLDKEDMSRLADFLKSPDCLVTALNLSNNPLPEVGMQYLYKALNESKAPKTLQMLSLCGRENHKWVAKETLKFLQHPRCGLQVLDLSGRKFCTDSDWIQPLCRILGQQERCQAKLEKLHIFAHDRSTTSDSRLLIEALKGPNCGISSITFSWSDPQCQKEAEDAIMSRHPPSRKTHESLTRDDRYISQAAEASSSGNGPSRNTHDEYISQASSSCNDPRMELLVRDLAAHLAAINNRVSDISTDVAAIKTSVSDIQTDVAAMKKRVSYTIQLLQNYIQNGQKELPFLPWILMDVKKTKDLQKPPINIKTDTLYLMCESPIKGFHHVKDQKGLKLQNVKAPPKWLESLMQVLVPALKLLVFTTELVIVGIHVAHGLVSISPGKIQSLFELLINSCNVTHNYPPDKWTQAMKETALYHSVADLQKKVEQMDSGPRPDRASLEEFYANLLRGSEAAKELDMAKTFNLWRALFPDDINFFWVCGECRKDCPDGTTFSNENPFRKLPRPKKQH